jgi:signal transduction histidine kinase
LPKLSLPTRLFAGFILLLLLFSGLQIYTLMNLEKRNAEFKTINQFHLNFSLKTYALETKQSSLLLLLKSLGWSYDEQGKKRPKLFKRWIKLIQDKRTDAFKSVEHLAKKKINLLSKKDKKYFKKHILPLISSIKDEVTDLHRRFNKYKKDKKLTKAEIKYLYRREHLLMAKIRRLVFISRNRAKNLLRKLEDDENTHIRQQIILLVCAFILGIVVIVLSSRPLKYLKSLTNGAREFGKSKYNYKIPVTSNDEFGELAKEFNQMAGAIKNHEAKLIRTERLAAAGKLAAQIAHEIRNPLAAMTFQVELLQDNIIELEGDKEIKLESIDIINLLQKEVDRLTGITQEYLNFARLPKPNLIKNNLTVFLKDFLDFVQGELILEKIKIETDFEKEKIELYIDEDLIRQVMLNLFRNAKEAMENGGTIEVFTKITDSHIILTVKDNGKGIKQEKLDKIFEPFYTTKKHGTGLGLSLSQQIVHEHMGTMEISSTPGEGSIVVMKFPKKSRTKK